MKQYLVGIFFLLSSLLALLKRDVLATHRSPHVLMLVEIHTQIIE